MIEIKKIRIHPFLSNSQREYVQEWIDNNCVNNDLDEWALITSNYTYSRTGDFDVLFKKNSDAVLLFQLTFPDSEILEIEQDVTFEVDEKHFNNLFEVEE